MRDSEAVAAIVAGDANGLAEAYDTYAVHLYTYCRFLLSGPADAADAVQDTFIVAASRLRALRDPDQLRPWLYTVARNECRRRIRAGEATSAPQVSNDTADLDLSAEHTKLRALVRSAIRGLLPGEQEVLILQLAQGPDGAEVAAVLGISRHRMQTLLPRARDQLKTAIGVLLVAQAGRQDCPALDELLTDWDGLLTVQLCERINQHIERCAACNIRRRRELRDAKLAGGSAATMLPLAATEVAGGIRPRVLETATGKAPAAVAYRTAVGRRAGPFRHRGFPKPLDPPEPRWRPRAVQTAAGAGATTVAAAVIAVAFLGGTHNAGAPLAGAAPGTSRGVEAGNGGSQGPGTHGRSAHHRALPVADRTAGPSATARIPSSPARGSSPTPSASPSGRASSPGRSPSPSPSASAAQGTLSVSPTTISLASQSGSTITLTAENGPVHWTISEPSSLLGEVTVSPSSGTLAAGQSTSVTVSGSASLDTQLSVNPGGTTVTVIVGLGLLSSGG